MQHSIANKRAIVVGGSRGIGLGMVEALAAQGVQVSVVARRAAALRAVSERLSIDAIEGDATDASLAAKVLTRVRPDLLVINAGVTPISGGMRDITWDTFSTAWNVDVQAGFHWVQAALRLPLAAGSRVVLLSSGAAIYGVPNTGSYSGAKRMLWLMAHYANAESQKLGLGVHFQTVVPLGLVPDTGVGQMAAAFHAENRGMSVEAFWETCRPSLSARQVGEYVATLFNDPAYATGVAFGVNGAAGITALDTKD